MFAVLFAINLIILPALLVIVIYSIIHGLVFQEPEVPATGTTRSRSIQH